MIGQIVLSCQDTVSQDGGTIRTYLARMATTNEEAVFNQAFYERIKRLREGRGMSAEQMATALGIPAERYRKYENRSPIPSYLVERFALIVGREIEYVLTGKISPIRGAPVKKPRKRA